jgi:hypothetical protein
MDLPPTSRLKSAGADVGDHRLREKKAKKRDHH